MRSKDGAGGRKARAETLPAEKKEMGEVEWARYLSGPAMMKMATRETTSLDGADH